MPKRGIMVALDEQVTLHGTFIYRGERMSGELEGHIFLEVVDDDVHP